MDYQVVGFTWVDHCANSATRPEDSMDTSELTTSGHLFVRSRSDFWVGRLRLRRSRRLGELA